MVEKADIVVSPIIKAMLDKLFSPLLRDFGSQWEVKEELDELCTTLERIDAILGSVELKQQKDALLRISLRDLRDLAYFADDALDEFIYEAQRRKLEDERNQNRSKSQVHNSFSFSLNADQLLRRHEIAPFLTTEIREKFVNIEKKLERHYDFKEPDERRQHDMICSFQSLRRETGSSVDDSNVLGRNKDASDIINMLLSEPYKRREISVVTIAGMGGIGKTTLAQLIYNHPHVKTHFDVRSWVCVSDDFDVLRLTKLILESAARKVFKFKELEPLQRELEDRIRDKRILLVLDDVWNENPNKWNALRVPFGVAGEGSTIIVTTRSQKVSFIMGAMKTLSLHGLSDKDCWLLFKKRAFIDNNSDAHPNLKPIGKKIVRKCKGLPLAVNALGGLLCGKVDEDEWQGILDSEMWELEEIDILPALRLSYYHLPAHLKLCFAYCSLFPKDYEFDKENLVQLWMAEGFIPSKKAEKMEDIGSQCFDNLFLRSFFQNSNIHQRNKEKETIVMHDLMHDLAQSVSMGMCFRMESDKACEISEKARHMSFDICHVNLVDNDYYKCRKLSTFLNFKRGFSGSSKDLRWSSMKRILEPIVNLKHQRDLDVSGSTVPRYLFDALRCLRVLDLSWSSIERLSESIGNLKHLRYLNLSFTGITVLPEQTCDLYNLLTLNLQGCEKLCELPTNMCNLINLQHLIMYNESWLKFGPQLHGIGRLTCLKTLPYFSVGQADGFKITELKKLGHLQGRLCISELNNIGNVMEAKEANLKNKQKLGELELRWCSRTRLQDGGDVDETVFEALQLPTELKSLTIVSYHGLRFPSWMMTDLSCYNKLLSLKLDSCRRLASLPDGLQRLSSLQRFHIVACGIVVLPNRLPPMLNRLDIDYCFHLESLSNDLRYLSSLQALSIRWCSKLTSLPEEGLPTSLRSLSIQYCPALVSRCN